MEPGRESLYMWRQLEVSENSHNFSTLCRLVYIDLLQYHARNKLINGYYQSDVQNTKFVLKICILWADSEN